MKKIKFKVTEELNKIIEQAAKYAAERKQIEIVPATLVYFIIEKYLYQTSDKNLDSKTLFKLVNDLDVASKQQLEVLITKCLETRNIKVDKSDLYNADNIMFNRELEIIFSRSEGSARIRSLFDDNEVVTINTDDLLLELLSDSKNQERDRTIITVLEGFKIVFDTFMRNRMNENEEKLLKTIMGEKTLNYQDSETGKKDDGEENNEDDKNNFENAGTRSAISSKKIDPNSKTPALDQFAVNMTDKAKNNEYDPVVGRNKEINQILEILCCRKKNNAILIGDPGAGKTSVIEFLAQQIANNQVPRELKNKQIFSLDLNALVSGTQYRGQYEQRLQDIIKEVISNKNIIIFIDEIHNLIGNGSSGGTGDGANILKPYLARGEFQCIGSTTLDEYRKFIEKDGALKRRFSPVYVNEPNVQETIEILKGLAPTYSKFHKVNYSDLVLEKCTEWAGKYINDKYFPDKAITALDMASSIAKLSCPKNDKQIEQLEQQINDLKKQKQEKIDQVDLDTAGEIRDKIIQLNNEILRLENDTSKNPDVTLEHVSNVISKLSNIPVDKIMSSDINKIKHMKEPLEKQIIGQQEAVDQVTLALQRNILGLRDPNKPICSLLLVGETGTGKTLISKLVAKEFMGSENNLITIACSEYMQDWAESKLLGSAPGYVGYTDSEPRLYVLKRKPYSVLLIDEVEKSSSNLYNIWLNMLEEGEITLSSGEKISCKNTIIIFTGNVGTKSLNLKGNGIGFDELNKSDKRKVDVNTVMKEVKKEFRPEFLNRLSNIIVFNSLGIEELGQIFYLELKKLQDRLQKNNGYTLEVTENVKNYIVNKCEPKYGARSLQRLIIEHIEQNICREMINQDITGKYKINVDLENDNVTVNFS